MAIYVHVKHYLTAEGISYFPGWFQRVYDVMAESPGFVSLTSEQYPEEGLVHIVVCFDSENLLEEWGKQPVHDELVDELDAYRSKDFWEAGRTQDELADWKTLAYDHIQATSPNANRG